MDDRVVARLESVAAEYDRFQYERPQTARLAQYAGPDPDALVDAYR